jgi:hypothetical protein
MNEPFIEASGPSLGAVTVYSRSNDRDAAGNLILKPIWRLYNHQGPDWQYAQVMIREPTNTVSNSHKTLQQTKIFKGDSLSSSEQVIIEGTWGSTRASGIIAFDDITFFGGPCTSKKSKNMI